MAYSVSYTAAGDGVSYVNLEGPLTEKDIRKIIAIGGMDRIQARFLPRPEDLTALNWRYYSLYPQTGLRLYSLDAGNDCADLARMTNIRKLSLSSWENVDNIDALSRLARFRKLKVLDLSYKKNIDALAELPELESLTLSGVTPASLSFINRLAGLKRLRIHRGSIHDFSELYGNESIVALQLFRIANLDSAELVARLPNLEALELSQLRHISKLPDLSAHQKLRHVLLDDMKSLADLSGLEHCAALESFHFSMCPPCFALDGPLPVLRNRRLRQCALYTSSAKKNEQFGKLIAEYGKEKKSSFITVRKMLYNCV
ncbi:MAG: hypothetical protein LBQ63_06430 [Deltaproteobacteria bacterium]|jgi:hypothetical protein|nr:hypothetical protein [Deltaproteobacteria bacterium]